MGFARRMSSEIKREQQRYPENAHRAKLLDRRAIRLTTGYIPVRSDVFLHRLAPDTLEALRLAVEQGLTPSGLDFGGDDDEPIVVLQFTRHGGG